MNESHEPSYYEIALTHRQVLVAFVVLLVALVAAFFTGVWVGKGGAAGPAAVQAVKPAPAAAEAPLEEFRFFSEEGKPPAGARPAPAAAERVEGAAAGERRPVVTEARPGATLAADLGADAEGRAALPLTAGSETEAPGEGDPAPPERAVQAPSAVPAVPNPPSAAGLVVQVFSSPDGAQAQRILQRLVAGGYRAFLSPVQVDSQTMHRVRIGPFAERSEAQRIADQVRQRFKLDTWITR